MYIWRMWRNVLTLWSSFWVGWACAAACSSAPPMTRCEAVHEFSVAICERAVFCGRLVIEDISTCEVETFGAICTDNTCDGVVMSSQAVDTCADAIRELACAESDWPGVCYGATQ